MCLLCWVRTNQTVWWADPRAGREQVLNSWCLLWIRHKGIWWKGFLSQAEHLVHQYNQHFYSVGQGGCRVHSITCIIAKDKTTSNPCRQSPRHHTSPLGPFTPLTLVVSTVLSVIPSFKSNFINSQNQFSLVNFTEQWLESNRWPIAGTSGLASI